MKPIRWSAHAEKQLVYREIDRREGERTLEQPDDILPSGLERSIYQRRYFDKLLNEEMLLRIVVEEKALERVVVTLYKTSRLDKYGR